MDAIPIKRFMGKNLMTDGHTRAALAILNGETRVPCYWDEDELDMAAYAADIALCLADGIKYMPDLALRVVPHKEYEILWHKRCVDLYSEKLYKYLAQSDEVIYWTQKPTVVCERDIHELTKSDLSLFNEHLTICGQRPISDEKWAKICADRTTYFLLFMDGKPVARAAIEAYSEAFHEVSDVRCARDYRNRGLATVITANVTDRILSTSRVALCRTLPENEPMKRIIAKLGYKKLYE